MSEKKEETKPQPEKSGNYTIEVPKSRLKRISALQAEMASLNARLHEHLAIICEDNAVDPNDNAVFAPDFETVMVTKPEQKRVPKLEPE